MIAALSLFSGSPLAEAAEAGAAGATAAVADPLEGPDAAGAPTQRAARVLDELIAKLVVVPGEARPNTGAPAPTAKKAPPQGDDLLAAEADEDEEDDDVDPTAILADPAARAAGPPASKLDAVDLAWIAIHAQSTATPASPPETAPKETAPKAAAPTVELAPRTLRAGALTEALARSSLADDSVHPSTSAPSTTIRPAAARATAELAPAELTPAEPPGADPLDALVDEPFASPPSSGPVPSGRAASTTTAEPAIPPGIPVGAKPATAAPPNAAAPTTTSGVGIDAAATTAQSASPGAPRAASGRPATRPAGATSEEPAAPARAARPSPGRYAEIREPRAPANDAFAPPDEPFSPSLAAAAPRFTIEDLGVDRRERDEPSADATPLAPAEPGSTHTTHAATTSHGQGHDTAERHPADPLRASAEARDARELASAKSALERGEGARGSVELGDAGRVDVHALTHRAHVEVRVAAERDAVAHALASQAPAMSAELTSAGIPARVVVADPSWGGGGGERQHRAPSERDPSGDAERGASQPSAAPRGRSRFVL